MSRFALLLLVLLTLFFAHPTFAQVTDIHNYCIMPPFIATGTKPNVLLIMDNSASMTCRAYATQAFNPGREYFGIFNPNKWYSYDGNSFNAVALKSSRPKAPNEWDGNILNYLGMRRVDVLRYAMVRGSSNDQANALEVENTTADGVPALCTGDTSFNSLIADAQNFTPYAGASAQTATCCNSGIVARNEEVFASLSPAFTIPAVDATAATISWNLSGNTDLTTCARIRLEAPDGSSYVLKDYGQTDPVSFNLTSIYQAEGPGTYTIYLSERTACGNNQARARLSDVSMIVQGGTGQACFHFEGGGQATITINPDNPSACVSAPNQGDRFNLVVTTPGVGNTVAECDDNQDGNCDGVIRKVINQVRWGLMQYASSQGAGNIENIDGGNLVSPIDDGNAQNFLTQIMNDNVTSVGSLAETLWTAIGYYSRNFDSGETGPNYGNNAYNQGQGDPFCNFDSIGPQGNTVQRCVPCAQPYILFITDGEPERDTDLPDPIKDISETWAGSCNQEGPNCTSTGLLNGNSQCCMDNVALYGRSDLSNPSNPRARDIRSDLSGNQTVTTFIVFAFGQGSQTIKIAARNGGFEDSNGNFVPDLQSEWDKNLDGLPDNYFEAQDGNQIERAITEVINEILKRSASSTSATVLASGEGQGANLVQAFFFPRKNQGTAELSWLGFLQNLWFFVDPFLAVTSIRENTVRDTELDLREDKILEFFFDTSEEKAKARLFTDADGDGIKDDPSNPDIVPIDNVKSLWEAGLLLFLRGCGNSACDTTERTIFTSTDGTTLTEFTLANVDQFFSSSGSPNLLQATDQADAQDIITYIRGNDTSGSRSRTTQIRVDSNNDGTPETDVTSTWKLGDIVTSTAKIQGPVPLNSYHNTYADDSYRQFISSNEYKSRGMVYVGANDGMLHAFKLGLLEFTGSFVDNPFEKANLTGSNLGREEWAYIPKNALPYLRYLRNPDYCHLFYVDGTPFLFDASIGITSGCTDSPSCERKTTFSNTGALDLTETTWRTIVIGSMRLGGACGCTDANCVTPPATALDDSGQQVGRSAYFALDVTDPAEPVLLWEFAHPDLGYSTSGPAIVRIKAQDGSDEDPDANGHWFAVFASGPTGRVDRTNPSAPQFTGESEQTLKIFVVDLATGNLEATFDMDDEGITEDAFAGNILNVTVDTDKDYEDDVFYIGYTQRVPNTTNFTTGGIIRFITKGNPDPTQWVPTPLLRGIGPVSASLTNLIDPIRGELWIYGGTGRFHWKINDNMDDATSQRHIFGFKEPCAEPQNPVGVVIDPDCTDTLTWPGDLEDATTTVIDPNTADGWRISLDLPSGADRAERLITNPLGVFSGAVLFTTTKPTGDFCTAGGKTFLWAIRHNTGGSGASLLYGTGLVQTSTGAIESIQLGQAFTERAASQDTTTLGRRTGAIMGLSTSTTPPPVIMPKPYKRIISVVER